MKSGILFSSPDLRPSLLSVLPGLAAAGILNGLVTTLAIDPTSPWGRMIGRMGGWGLLGKAYERRIVPSYLAGKTSIVPWRESLRVLAQRFAGPSVTHRVWHWAELGFDQTVAREFAGQHAVLYGMEHSSKCSFEAQKDKGGRCVLRQVNAHGAIVQKVLTTQLQKYPEQSTNYSRLLMAGVEEVTRRKIEEYRLADLIVVNSSYVRETFLVSGVERSKVVAIPTGCPDIVCFHRNDMRQGQRVRFLFAGSLSLRKGIQYLLEAWHKLHVGSTAELWLAGDNSTSSVNIQGPDVRYLGHLSRAQLKQRMEEADVFVLPSLCEGLAHSVLEALSCGLPIITTHESGASGFISSHNGFVVPSADAEALAAAMHYCIENPSLLGSMGEESLRIATSWTVADSNNAHLMLMREFLDTGKIIQPKCPGGERLCADSSEGLGKRLVEEV